MEEQHILIETARLAHEKGFNIPIKARYCCAVWDDNQYRLFKNGIGHNSNESKDSFSAPTQGLLQKWLRETHKIHVDISVGDDSHYGVIYGTTDTPEWIREEDDIDVLFFPTYEEALEAGLQAALNIVSQ